MITIVEDKTPEPDVSSQTSMSERRPRSTFPITLSMDIKTMTTIIAHQGHTKQVHLPDYIEIKTMTTGDRIIEMLICHNKILPANSFWSDELQRGSLRGFLNKIPARLSRHGLCRIYARLVTNTCFFGFVLSRLLLRHLGFDSDFAQISEQKIGGWGLCLKYIM